MKKEVTNIRSLEVVPKICTAPHIKKSLIEALEIALSEAKEGRISYYAILYCLDDENINGFEAEDGTKLLGAIRLLERDVFDHIA